MSGFDSFFGVSTTQADAVRWLEDCEQAAHVAPHNGGPNPEFNDWEHKFLVSVRAQLNDGRVLSTKQIASLKSLWDRI